VARRLRRGAQPGVGGAVAREARERRAHGLEARGEALAQPLVARGGQPELDEQAEGVRRLVELLHPAVAAGQRALPRRLVAVEQRDLLGDLGGQVLLHERDQEVVLGAEVPVHGALGQAGLLRDVVERRAREAARGVDARGGVEQPRARGGLARAAVELAARHQATFPRGIQPTSSRGIQPTASRGIQPTSRSAAGVDSYWRVHILIGTPDPTAGGRGRCRPSCPRDRPRR
jgi:hypothetical protein